MDLTVHNITLCIIAFVVVVVLIITIGNACGVDMLQLWADVKAHGG